MDDFSSSLEKRYLVFQRGKGLNTFTKCLTWSFFVRARLYLETREKEALQLQLNDHKEKERHLVARINNQQEDLMHQTGQEALSTGGPKAICKYWFAGLNSSKWLSQHFRLDVIEYDSNEFQNKLNLDLNFIK